MIQAEANRRMDKIRLKRGFPAFSFAEHVAHKTHADRIDLTDDERAAILAEEFERAEARHRAAQSRAKPERRPPEPSKLDPDQRASKRKERAERLAQRVSRMSPEDLLRQSARRQVRAVTAPSRRVIVNNRAHAKQVPIAKPKPPSKRKDWTLTLDQRFEILRRQNGRCAVTNLPFEIIGEDFWKSRHPLSPSLDRIDSSRGYTFDNAKLVCLLWNLGKNTTTEQVAREAFLTIAEALRDASRN